MSEEIDDLDVWKQFPVLCDYVRSLRAELEAAQEENARLRGGGEMSEELCNYCNTPISFKHDCIDVLRQRWARLLEKLERRNEEIILSDRANAALRARCVELEAENARLREAATGVVEQLEWLKAISYSDDDGIGGKLWPGDETRDAIWKALCKARAALGPSEPPGCGEEEI